MHSVEQLYNAFVAPIQMYPFSHGKTHYCVIAFFILDMLLAGEEILDSKRYIKWETILNNYSVLICILIFLHQIFDINRLLLLLLLLTLLL